MSSGVTLTAATRQNLLSLQGTADLVATTQNRLATGKKVNSALDNPTNFFTASALSSRSSDLSALLDGIGNGVQTIQAANTGLTKLQSLANQLKSTAQQALSSSNAFTSKATATSTALAGATASNLLSTGATVAAGNNAVGTLTAGLPPTAPVTATTTGSVDYAPTASATKLVSGAAFTPTTSTRATTTGATFAAPANAVAGAVTTGNVGTSGALAANASYTITPNGGSAINVAVLAGDSIDTVVGKINADTGVVASGVTAAKSGNAIVFTGNANGTSFTVNGSTAETGLTSATASTGQQAAATQALTINGAAITISGGNAGATAAQNLTAALAAINAQTSTTNVSAAQGVGADVGKIVLTGPASLASFTVNGVANNTLGFPSGANATVVNNAVPAASQTIGVNGTQITLLGGATQTDAIAAINAQTAVTGVSAAVDASDPTRIAFTGKNDGAAFTVTSSNPASSGLPATSASSIAATTSGGVYVPTTGSAAALTGAAAFTAPANAIAGSATGGTYATLTANRAFAITSGANTYNVNLATGTTLSQAVTQLNAALGGSGLSVATNVANDALVFTGRNDGTAFSVDGGNAETGFATSTNSTGQAVAATQTLTIGSTAITISGGNAGASAATNLAAALTAINAQTATTGVTASQGLGADAGKILLAGLATTGADFSVTGGAGNTLGFAASATSTATAGPGRTAGVAPASQTLTINGAAITIAGGATIDQAIAAINTANTGASATGVSAARDPANSARIKLTGANTAGTSFTVASSNGASSGFPASPTKAYSSAGVEQTVTVNGAAIAVKSSATLDDAIAAINAQTTTTGVTAARGAGSNSNKLVFSGRSDGSSFTVQGSADNTLGVATTASTIAGTLDPAATSLVSTIGFQANDNFSVNGQLVTLSAGDTIASLVQKVGAATNGAVNASYDTATNKFSFTAADSSTAVTLADGSTATSKVANLGFTTTSFTSGLGASGSTSALNGKSLTVQVGSGANVSTTSVTFGSAPGQISTLTQLNVALAPANAQATIDTTTGKLSISTTNDYGAENLSVTGTGAGNPFTAGAVTAAIGGDGLNTRNGLVTSYNNLLTQIDQLAADAGYNGVNLLTGDNLKISFNEKGTSSLSVQGNAVTSSSLGLSAIGQNTFQESSSINKLIEQINTATSSLKSQASSLGSNLAVVQNRQDFSKSLINILDTGAANLTNADLNEEAANSQALSTRQSLGISALSLANTAQQGVLQLLR